MGIPRWGNFVGKIPLGIQGLLRGLRISPSGFPLWGNFVDAVRTDLGTSAEHLTACSMFANGLFNVCQRVVHCGFPQFPIATNKLFNVWRGLVQCLAQACSMSGAGLFSVWRRVCVVVSFGVLFSGSGFKSGESGFQKSMGEKSFKALN